MENSGGQFGGEILGGGFWGEVLGESSGGKIWWAVWGKVLGGMVSTLQKEQRNKLTLACGRRD